jgi:LmbE family N-acetylglucosaminyl deacetylase
MIVPLVSEEEWCVRLSALPAWPYSRVMSRGPVLIVAPHPDDETLGAGGLIAHLRDSGIEVLIAAVTDGENAYGADSHGLGEVRAEEQTAALARLGVTEESIVRFRLCDSDVSSHEGLLEDLLAPLVRRSTHVVAPWMHDFHPDHEACGRVAGRLTQEFEIALTSYFFWTWHRGEPGLLSGLPLVRFPLSAQIVDRKQSALACHRSQLYRSSGDPILPERLLAPAYRSFETYLLAQVQHDF